MADEADPLVRVEVLVNVGGLRRGWIGEVEFTRAIDGLVRSGYLRILGHVNVTPEAPPAAPEPPAPEMPAAAPRRSRAKRNTTTTPPEADDGDSPGHA